MIKVNKEKLEKIVEDLQMGLGGAMGMIVSSGATIGTLEDGTVIQLTLYTADEAEEECIEPLSDNERWECITDE